MTTKQVLLCAATALVIAGCDDLKDELSEELGAGKQTSYCEGLCAKAISCNAEERTIDEAAVETACLSATHAADPGCATAESESGVDPASSEALTSCTDSVADLGCEPFTGSLDQLVQALPPGGCATQGTDFRATFEAARYASFESNDSLCDRRITIFCGRLTECIGEEFGGAGGGVPQDAIDIVGFEPNARCLEANQALTDSCKTELLYAPEPSLVDPAAVNTARQSARICVRDLGTAACGPLLDGQIPEFCAGAFTTTEQSTEFVTTMAEIARPFVEEAARR